MENGKWKMENGKWKMVKFRFYSFLDVSILVRYFMFKINNTNIGYSFYIVNACQKYLTFS